MSSNALVPCPDCGHLVSRLAEACPSCARPLRKPAPREGLFLRTMNQLLSASIWVLLLLFLVPIAAALLGILLTRR
jgi:predicted amidophosphoribosyltransferase